MSGLFGGGQSSSQVAERIASIQIQTSSYGGALPIIYGTNRTAANLIAYDDFKAIAKTTKTKTGKGGGSTMSNTTWTYTAMVILAVCEGPIQGINRVWRDKEIGSLAGWGFTLFNGNRTQAPWSYLSTKHPDKALGYAGTAIVCHSAVDLGDNATLRNHSFEVSGLLVIGGGNPDSHPADFIPDFLTNEFYGAGWEASRIGDLSTGAASFQTYCTAAGFFMSPVIKEQKEARAHLDLFLEATNSGPVWSSDGTKMVLKLIPYGDQAITGNGTTYTPNTTPLYDLGPDDFMPGQGEDPVRVEIVPQADSFNICPVEFMDRALDYNAAVVEDPEPVDVDAFGPRKAQVASLHYITRASHALAISRIKAQRSIQCRNRYRFRLGWRYILLEPMDLVTITDEFLELNKKVVRLLEIEETEDGFLEVLAEEWPFGVATATAYTTQAGDGYIPDVNADPGNADAPVIFQAPALLTAGADAEVWLATAGGALWGGCEVWVSTDGGSSYSLVGSIDQPARHGTLTDTLAAWTDPATVDGTNIMEAVLAHSSQQLVGGTNADRDALDTLTWVGGELLAYRDATLVSPGEYNLASLRRGAYGTAMGSKAPGTQWARLDEAVFRYPVPANRIGSTLHIKLRSFNVWGGGAQDLAALTPYTFTPTAAPLPSVGSATMTVSDTKPA